MRVVESFLAWLPTIIVKAGDVRWSVSDRFGQQFKARLALGNASSLELEAPGRGILSVGGRRIEWRPAGGIALQQDLSDDSVLDQLRHGISSDFTAIAQRIVQLTHGDMRRELAWLAGTSADVTVLVIPGISAFGIRTPPLDLGSVLLPPMGGDISLRNVAIDLSGGHVAFELRIHRAEAAADGILKLGMQGATLEVAAPSFRLAADVVCAFKDHSANAALDWMEFESDRLQASLPRPTGGPATFTASKISASCRNFVSKIDLRTDAVNVSSGELTLSIEAVDLRANDVALGPLRAESITALGSNGVEANLGIVHSNYRGTIRARTLQITATQPEIANLPVEGSAEIDSNVPIVVDARGIEIALPAFELQAGIIDVDATLRKAAIRLSGLNIDVTDPVKIRGEVAYSGFDRREGALLNVPRATLTSPHFPGSIELLEATAKRWSEKPAALLGASKSILQSRTINELSILVELPPFTLLPGQRVDIRPEDLDLFMLFLRFLVEKIGSVGVVIQKVIEAMSSLMDKASALRDILMPGLGFLVRIDDIRLVVGYKDVTVRLDPENSNDNILTFRISTGLTGVGAKFRVSWPSPKWDDWGHRDSREIGHFIEIRADFPDLAVEIRFTYDAAAKRIAIEKGSFYFAIGQGDVVVVEKYLQQALMLYFGVGPYVDSIVSALNVRLPTGLPSHWDVANLQIAKPASDQVKGISINLRATETQFASL